MNEGDCRIRRGNAAELFSGIRHIAMNILRQENVFKAGLRRKMRKAAIDDNYLATVLAGCGGRNFALDTTRTDPKGNVFKGAYENKGYGVCP